MVKYNVEKVNIKTKKVKINNNKLKNRKGSYNKEKFINLVDSEEIIEPNNNNRWLIFTLIAIFIFLFLIL